MPRINRRLRALPRAREVEVGSTKWQTLMWGSLLLPEDGPDFNSEGELRAAWQQCRSELLKESQVGMRPWAYFRFDLGIVDRVVDKWHEQIDVLFDRGLIGAEEAERIEQARSELNPQSAPNFGSAFEDEHCIRQQHLGQYILSGLADGFEVAAKWHRWRARPELAARYELRAAVVRSVVQENVL